MGEEQEEDDMEDELMDDKMSSSASIDEGPSVALFSRRIIHPDGFVYISVEHFELDWVVSRYRDAKAK